MTTLTQLFPLGNIYQTPGVMEAIPPEDVAQALARHQSGDWGDLGEADKQENELSVEQGFRILSAYTTSAGDTIWILTEADRSATTILLPEEY